MLNYQQQYKLEQVEILESLHKQKEIQREAWPLQRLLLIPATQCQALLQALQTIW